MTDNDPTDETSQPADDLFAPRAFVVSVVCGFVLLVVIQCLWIVRITFGPSSGESGRWSLWAMWAALPMLALLWGLLNLRWAAAAMRQSDWNRAYPYLGVLLCCGLGGLGLQTLLVARSLSDTPITVDFSHLAAARAPNHRQVPTAANGAAAAGDPTEGKSIFATSCAVCHGATGDGLSQLAPSFRTSEFVKNADEHAIRQLILQGRDVSDPANRSGKAMPARGGNPFLTDQQASHLAAFVKTISASSPGTAEHSTGEPGEPAAQLSRWIVPAAAEPPAGLIRLNPAENLIGTSVHGLRNEERRSGIVRYLGLAAVAVHGLFLLGLFLASSQFVFGQLLGVRIPSVITRFQVIAWGWGAAALAWAVLWVLFGWT